MNRTSDTSIANNPWQEREALPPVSPIHKILAAVAVFLSALGLPVCLWNGLSAALSEGLGILLLLLLCVYTFKTARSTPTLPLLFCTAFGLTFVVGLSFTGGAVVLAVIVSLAAGSFLTTVTGRPYLTLLCHAAAFAIAFAITRDPIGSLLTLTTLPAALLAAFATLKDMGRTRVVCYATGGLLFAAAAMIAFHLFYADVAFEREAIFLYVDSLRTSLFDAAVAIRDESIATLKGAQTGAAADQLIEQFQMLYSDEMLRTTVTQLFNLLPALLTVFCLGLAYEANSLLLTLHASAGLGAVNTGTARRIIVGAPASVVFILAFLLMMLLPEGEIASAVVQNLALILLPGLALFGGQRLMLVLFRLQGMMRFLLAFAVLALLFCNLGGALYILALWGAYSSIGDLLRAILIERIKRNGGNGTQP